MHLFIYLFIAGEYEQSSAEINVAPTTRGRDKKSTVLIINTPRFIP